MAVVDYKRGSFLVKEEANIEESLLWLYFREELSSYGVLVWDSVDAGLTYLSNADKYPTSFSSLSIYCFFSVS